MYAGRYIFDSQTPGISEDNRGIIMRPHQIELETMIPFKCLRDRYGWPASFKMTHLLGLNA